ncbi:RNA ligase [Flavobacterium sp. 9AF]|uniref:RNA ligase n=1 Tax=Flavobacterium sp. 9AF TaxID=2653142 RepID=UPI0012F44B3E|nr:RNA ligase [Flavobacterium sp. 9AF]VXB85197.1 RNA ligase [Flavobacterium sp. 9AF]
MNKALLQQMIDEGYIKVNKHPEWDLFIYNYSQTVQFERLWNEVTLACRGIIMDGNQNIVARPFPKFFNLGEQEGVEIPKTSFEVYDKMDGSLGILYWVNQIPYIASRGSFTSEQATRGTKLLHTIYKENWKHLNPNKTYLFEIIYPENRIVLDYGTAEALVLLGIIEIASGKELPLEDIGFPIVEKYDGIEDILTLKNLEKENKEGFVIRFENGFRMKVKFDEYVRLHRIITQLTSIDIWEHLMNKLPLDEIIEHVPDEFFNWVKNKMNTLNEEFQIIEKQCKNDFKILETRKETAAYFYTCQFPAVLFLMLDNKSYEHEIWKRIRPTFEKPFMNSEEK